MPYQLTIEERPTYLYARVTGERTPANALRFLEEVYAACVERGHSAVLMDMAFSGEPLPAASIYGILSQRAPDGAKLRKIAYVQAVADDPDAPDMPRFAETVARNRGVNVRLFRAVVAAERWLTSELER